MTELLPLSIQKFLTALKGRYQANRLHSIAIWALAAGLFAVPWINFNGWNNPLMMQFFFFLGITAVIILLLLWATGKGTFAIPSSPLWWVVGLLAGSKILSTIFSVLPLRSIWGAYMFMADGLVLFGCLCVLGLFFLALKPTDKEVRGFLVLFFVQAILLSLDVLGEAVHGGAPIKAFRAVSILTNSDYFISYLCLIIPVGMGIAVSAWRKAVSWLPALSIVGVVLCSLAFYTVLPYDLQAFGRQPTASPANAATFFVDSSNAERFTQWKLGLVNGEQYPLFGSGLGTNRALFFKNAKDLSNWNYQIAMDLPHNDLIQQFSQGGILGLFSYLFFWIGLFWLTLRNKDKVLPENRPYFWSTLGGLVTFLLFNQFLFTVQLTGILVTILVCVLLLLSCSVQFKHVTFATRPWQVTAAAVLLVSVPVFYWGARYAEAESIENSMWIAQNDGDLKTAASLAEQATETYPYDENYFMLASGFDTEVAVQSQNPIPLLHQAQTEIASAIALNPFIPKFRLNQGVTDYIVAQSTDDEAKSLKEMKGAIAELPWNNNYYLYAAQGLLLRPKAETGTAFFASLKGTTPGPLQSYVDSLQAQYNQVLAAKK